MSSFYRKTKTNSFFLVTWQREKAQWHLRMKKTSQSSLLNVHMKLSPINNWNFEVFVVLSLRYYNVNQPFGQNLKGNALLDNSFWWLFKLLPPPILTSSQSSEMQTNISTYRFSDLERLLLWWRVSHNHSTNCDGQSLLEGGSWDTEYKISDFLNNNKKWKLFTFRKQWKTASFHSKF